MESEYVILVVDDHPQNIELLEVYFAPLGYKIVTAKSGQEALDKLSVNPIDLILLDVMMTGMDGFEVTRRIRKDPLYKHIPVILITALRETEDRILGFESGCDDFISKPIDKMELLARVRSLLRVKAYNDQLNKAFKELERSNAELQQFAYVASHDLQEPLRMISSYLQLIEHRYKDKLDADGNEFINFAVNGANRMQSLIIGLLEYSRVGTHGNSFVEVNVSSLLDKVLKDLEVQINETGAVVIYEEMPVITADESQISRLFQNLIQNAVKFRREDINPRIMITFEKKGKDFEFCVKDNGIGIENQYFDRIFAIFQRLHTQDEYPGTGIGLSLCKKIVERHGGKIRIESQYGEGSSFYFIIPGGIQ